VQIHKFIFFIALVFFGLTGFSQSDTTKANKKKNKAIYGEARKATVMSAILPGLGQAYNRKWWKVPIVYAGIGGFGYLLYSKQQEYNGYSANLKAETDGDPLTINETKYTGDQLLTLKNDVRKFRDLGAIGCVIIYVLNIVDANVDAHLKTFDVSDDLSLQIRPYSNTYCYNNSVGFQTGVSLNLKFK
jgi:hypothetical protein